MRHDDRLFDGISVAIVRLVMVLVSASTGAFEMLFFTPKPRLHTKRAWRTTARENPAHARRPAAKESVLLTRL